VPEEKFFNSKSPFDSLDRLENNLASVNKLDDLFEEFNLSKYNYNDKRMMCHMREWHEEHNFDLIHEPKHYHCVKGKIREYVFCKDSESWGKNFRFAFNFDSMFNHDCFLVKGLYEWIPVDYKYQSNTFWPQKNPWNIHGGNFLTLKENQIPKMCRDKIPLVVIQRDVDFTKGYNQKVLSFAKSYPWTEEQVELKTENRICIVNTEQLCQMHTQKKDIIFLEVPENKRKKHNDSAKGNWDGKTVGFSFQLFSNFLV
jgi:hypothetical protein